MPVPEVLSALTTPFTADGVDLAAFDRQLARLQPLVDGVFVAGTTGEFPALTPVERSELLRRALDVFGPTRVVAHIGAASAHGAVQLAAAALELGATRFAAITPYYLPASTAGVAGYFAAIRGQLPDAELYAYLYPDVAGTDVLPADLIALVDAGIDGVKVSGRASTRVADYLAAVPAGLKLWSGNDADLPAVLAAGGLGTVSGVSGACPWPWADYRDAVRAGDDTAAADAQRRIEVLVAALGPSISRLRHGLELQGVAAGTARMSIDPPDEQARQDIGAALSAAGITVTHPTAAP